jgi:hypothetical protein
MMVRGIRGRINLGYIPNGVSHNIINLRDFLKILSHKGTEDTKENKKFFFNSSAFES